MPGQLKGPLKGRAIAIIIRRRSIIGLGKIRAKNGGCDFIKIQIIKEWGWIERGPKRRTVWSIKPARQYLLHERDALILRRWGGVRLDNVIGPDIPRGLFDKFHVGGVFDIIFHLLNRAQEIIL